MLILALVLLTSSAGVYIASSFITNDLMLQGCAIMCVLLMVAGIAVFLFELMVMPWREHGCELTIFDAIRDVKRKLFKL